MEWTIEFDPAFDAEFDSLSDAVQDELLAHTQLLARFGPALSRPKSDTLKGSRHPNMKELRFNAERGVWRVAFAFDPERRAILLVAGDKRGANQQRFYRRLIRLADERFDRHLARMQTERERP